jgi:hypothetical protein
MDFDSISDLHDFCLAVQKSLIDSLCILEGVVKSTAMENLDKVRSGQLRAIERRVDGLDQNSGALTLLASTPLTSGTRDDCHVRVHGNLEESLVTRTMPSTSTSEFHRMQARILGLFSRKQYNDLSSLSRAFLAAAAFIPYLLKKPFTPQKSEIPQYHLNIEELKTALRQVIGQPWVDAFSRQLQHHLQEENSKGQDIISTALKVASDASSRSLR